MVSPPAVEPGVTNEVKELSQETSRVTDDICAKISAIQDDTQAAVPAIHEIGKIIGHVNQTQNQIAAVVGPPTEKSPSKS